MPAPSADALNPPEREILHDALGSGQRSFNRWTCLVSLTAALCWSCGTAYRECTAFGEAGGDSSEAGQDAAGGRLCAPECSVFCGTKEECSRSNGGDGGNAP